MKKLIIELKDEKVYKLLQALEDLDLIRILKENPKLSALRGLVRSPMSNEEIDAQLSKIRGEWQGDII
jgi:hypothetical protein